MSTDTLERARLGTTHLLPRGLLNEPTTTVTAIGNSLTRIVVELEAKAAETNHLLLWHTVQIKGRVEPRYGAIGFSVRIESLALGEHDRADVLDLLFAAAMDKHKRELAMGAIEQSLEVTR